MGGAPHNKGTRRLPPSLLFISPKEQHSRRPPTQLDADGKHQFAAIWDHELQAPWWPQRGRMCALKAPRSEHRTSLGGWVSFICSFLWPGQEVFRRCVLIVTVHGPGSVRVCRPPKVAAALTCLISDPALHLPGIRGPLEPRKANRKEDMGGGGLEGKVPEAWRSREATQACKSWGPRGQGLLLLIPCVHPHHGLTGKQAPWVGGGVPLVPRSPSSWANRGRLTHLTATVHNIRAQRPLPGSRPISWGLSMCSSTLSNQWGLTVLQVECDKHQTWKRLKDQASRGIHSVV